MILDVTMAAMMQEYRIQMIDTSINLRKDLHFIQKSSWQDIMMVSITVAEEEIVSSKIARLMMEVEALHPVALVKRHYEGHNWSGICQSVDNLLTEPCDTLVTPDGRALTGEGKRVLEKLLCIAGDGISLIRPDLLPLYYVWVGVKLDIIA
jgi:hypothetical protein